MSKLDYKLHYDLLRQSGRSDLEASEELFLLAHENKFREAVESGSVCSDEELRLSIMHARQNIVLVGWHLMKFHQTSTFQNRCTNILLAAILGVLLWKLR